MRKAYSYGRKMIYHILLSERIKCGKSAIEGTLKRRGLWKNKAQNILSDLAKRKNLDLSDAAKRKAIYFGDIAEQYKKVEEWLCEIKNCDFLVTDSFHGCVFSIILKKHFIFIQRDYAGNGRLTNLFDMFHIKNRKK